MLVQRPGHRHGDVLLSGHDCRDIGQAADVRDQVMESQPPLVHLELDGCYGVGWRVDGIVPVLIAFDQVREDVALVAFRCANLGLKYLAESGQRGVVVFSPYGSGLLLTISTPPPRLLGSALCLFAQGVLHTKPKPLQVYASISASRRRASACWSRQLGGEAGHLVPLAYSNGSIFPGGSIRSALAHASRSSAWWSDAHSSTSLRTRVGILPLMTDGPSIAIRASSPPNSAWTSGAGHDRDQYMRITIP